MPVFEVMKDNSVFTTHKQPFQDVTLSLEAIGLVGFFISHNHNWTIRQSELYALWEEKRVRAALNELEQAGYINRRRFDIQPDQHDWLIEVFETPEQKRQSVDEFLKKHGGTS